MGLVGNKFLLEHGFRWVCVGNQSLLEHGFRWGALGPSFCWSMGLDGARWEPVFAGAWVYMGCDGNQIVLDHGFRRGVLGTSLCWSTGLGLNENIRPVYL